MTAAAQVGSAAIPQAAGTLPASTTDELDKAIAAVRAKKDAWVAVPIAERVALHIPGMLREPDPPSDPPSTSEPPTQVEGETGRV